MNQPMQYTQNRHSDQNSSPTRWESKVRGLMLGLALGDAIGSKRSDVPATGLLHAGVASQLAAWTTEGTLRMAARYGGHVVNNPHDVLRYAYQRWAQLRGTPPTEKNWYPFFDSDLLQTRGWLVDVPAMAETRGTSPATLKALTSGRPAHSAGCQALLRSLPIAAHVREGGMDAIGRMARAAAGLTHDDDMNNAPTGFAVQLVAGCLQSESFQRAFDTTIGNDVPGPVLPAIDLLIDEGMQQPCVPQLLERLAPDKTALSALAGGIYVALSFPDLDTIAEALEFAGWAPDGDSVAAMAGALLGAIHGYEALPTALTQRLELGWVMDQLAIDLARQVVQNQAGGGWKSEDPDPEPPLDPWWDTRYPGV